MCDERSKIVKNTCGGKGPGEVVEDNWYWKSISN
jgi:hypothetical protein